MAEGRGRREDFLQPRRGIAREKIDQPRRLINDQRSQERRIGHYRGKKWTESGIRLQEVGKIFSDASIRRSLLEIAKPGLDLHCIRSRQTGLDG